MGQDREEARQQAARAENRDHLFSHKHEAESKPEVERGYKFFKSRPTDQLPPVKLCHLSKQKQQLGSQEFKSCASGDSLNSYSNHTGEETLNEEVDRLGWCVGMSIGDCLYYIN